MIGSNTGDLLKSFLLYLIAANFLLKQEKKRFYIVYSLSWVGKKNMKEPSLGKEFFYDPAALQEFF